MVGKVLHRYWNLCCSTNSSSASDSKIQFHQKSIKIEEEKSVFFIFLIIQLTGRSLLQISAAQGHPWALSFLK